MIIVNQEDNSIIETNFIGYELYYTNKYRIFARYREECITIGVYNSLDEVKREFTNITQQVQNEAMHKLS